MLIGQFTSPYTALQSLIQNKITGYLEVYDPKDISVSWKLYLSQNRLHYGTISNGQSQRLSCFWKQTFKIESPLPPLTQLDYEHLAQWANTTELPESTTKQIIEQLTLEALIQVLGYNNAPVKLYVQKNVNPAIISLPVQELIKTSLEEIRKWKKLRPLISSPLNRLTLDSKQIDNFYQLWKQSTNKLIVHKPVAFWLKLFQKQPTIYEIAQEIKCDPLTIAQFLVVELKNNQISVLPFQTASSNKSAGVIACIDDSLTVQKQVKLMLEMHNYQVISITEPSRCLTTLARQKPDLILLDLTMPEMDGCTVCQMLRKSSQLNNIPIIMFTGRDNEMDRHRSEVAGANGYITKPVKPSILLDQVKNTMIHPPSVQHNC